MTSLIQLVNWFQTFLFSELYGDAYPNSILKTHSTSKLTIGENKTLSFYPLKIKIHIEISRLHIRTASRIPGTLEWNICSEGKEARMWKKILSKLNEFFHSFYPASIRS